MMLQLELFDTLLVDSRKRDYLGIPGLVYVQGLLTNSEQVNILAEIDKMPWQNDLKRRVQHYGYKYDYKARSINKSMYVGALPPFAVEVAQKLQAQNLVTELPDQLIVNEYQPGQGITSHVDCTSCFKNKIVTVSLGSVYEMDFISLDTGEICSTSLELGSALLMSDEGRYKWTHQIKARKNDHGIPRGRRVSLTYRNIILNKEA
ncbi:MAG: alpha-ketoglutarate-dependent dioxygenase AlkB [Limnothrix sp.]